MNLLIFKTPRSSIVPCAIGLLICLITCLIGTEDTFGQVIPTAPPGPIDTDNINNGGNQFGGGALGGGGGGGGLGGAGGGNLGAFSADDADLLGGVQIMDVRNQGFVGQTASGIQESGFVGPPGESLAPPLSGGANFGGGVNNNSGGNGGNGGGGNFGGNRQNGFGAAGQEKGFQIIRRGIRTNLTPQFTTPVIDSQNIIRRFNQRLTRQSNVSSQTGQLSVIINERIATVTGTGVDAVEKARYIRQLRLEPGIDRVVDQSN